ncbi:MAG: hypothetical protein KDE48_08120 [Anaerolineales bacterium]|nr:hypothetical protein [Anaerolineales bacterium]
MITKLLSHAPNTYLLITAVIIFVILIALLATPMDDLRQLTAVAPHPLPVLAQ